MTADRIGHVVDQWVFRILVQCQEVLLVIALEQIGRDVLPMSCRGSVRHKRFLCVDHLILFTCVALLAYDFYVPVDVYPVYSVTGKSASLLYPLVSLVELLQDFFLHRLRYQYLEPFEQHA